MKFAVGFQLYEGDAEPFSRVIELYRDKISEVFFAWQDIPTGRSGIASMHGYTDWTAQRRTEEELRKIKAMGVKLDLLFNANCYGQYSLSEKLANTVTSVLEHLEQEVGGVDIITTASPAIAHTVKKLIRTKGLRCRDIAIISRSESNYVRQIRSALRKNGVPVFEDRRQPIMTQPLIEFLLSATDIAVSGFSCDTVMRVLKTGMTDLTVEEISECSKRISSVLKKSMQREDRLSHRLIACALKSKAVTGLPVQRHCMICC